ncbi:MAG: HipA domain-containing protein [Clostridia bacterium]
MNCLYCGKPLPYPASLQETSSTWHDSCVKKFFLTNKLPDIDISDRVLEQIAAENVIKGFTVTGVQKKISLHLTQDNDPRLTLVNYPIGYILKPQSAEYIALPEAEYLAMQMAAKTGIKTVPFAMIRMQKNSYAYITRRIDRILADRKTSLLQKLAMEDFCQLSERLTEDKYRGSYESCARIISRYSVIPGLDLSELFLRIVFSYVIGNSDMHLKNFSLIETAPYSQQYALSDAYDILPVNVVSPEDEEQFALTLNGKKRNIKRNDFLIFAENCNIPQKSAEKMINKVASLQPLYISMCHDSYLPEDMKKTFEMLIVERVSILLK